MSPIAIFNQWRQHLQRFTASAQPAAVSLRLTKCVRRHDIQVVQVCSSNCGIHQSECLNMGRNAKRIFILDYKYLHT